jgi:hypothetical protein
MKPRNKGDKARIYFDDIDEKIIKIIEKNPMGILKLVKNIGIQHNSLKPHIDRLIKAGVLNYIDSERKLFITNKTLAHSLQIFASRLKIAKNISIDLREYTQQNEKGGKF